MGFTKQRILGLFVEIWTRSRVLSCRMNKYFIAKSFCFPGSKSQAFKPGSELNLLNPVPLALLAQFRYLEEPNRTELQHP
jgi:hypothetical protein